MKPKFVLWSALFFLLYTGVGAEEMKADDLQSCHWLWQLPETETFPGVSYANEDGVYKFMPAPIADSSSHNYAIWVAYSSMENRFGQVVRGIYLNLCYWGKIEEGSAVPKAILPPVTRVRQDTLFLVVAKYNRKDKTITRIGGPWLVWRQEVESGVAAVEAKSATPATFTLSQNYPNPFNPITTIKYSLPQAETVRLTIYNMLGQKVRDLVNVKQQAGGYNIVWDATDQNGMTVPTGVYFYRIEAGAFAQVRKMTLMK